MKRLALLVIAALVAGCAVAASPTSPPASPTAGSSTGAPTASAPAASASTPAASPTSAASPGGTAACEPAGLVARIARWEGAAGSWIAHIELANAGSEACELATHPVPQLVDAKGVVLIDGAAPASPSAPAMSPASPTPGLTLTAGGKVTTFVRVGNYCGPDPATPLSVAFVLATGRVVAAPPSPTDETVPACMGAPGSPGSIEVQDWAS